MYLRRRLYGGRLDVVRYLFEVAEVHGTALNIRAALNNAAHKGHLSVVRYLLEEALPVITRHDGGGDDRRVIVMPQKHEARAHAASSGCWDVMCYLAD